MEAFRGLRDHRWCATHSRQEDVSGQGVWLCHLSGRLVTLPCSNICVSLKDARSVSFRSELFTSYILTIFRQRNTLP